jgi:hypothetical protein
MEEVTIPLVEEIDDVGIPVKVQGKFAVISLVEPDGRRVKVVMENADVEKVEILVLEPSGQEEKSYLILQDWPQAGKVIPYSQDWPQDSVVVFKIKGYNGKTKMNLVVQQDWPQDSMEVILT